MLRLELNFDGFDWSLFRSPSGK